MKEQSGKYKFNGIELLFKTNKEGLTRYFVNKKEVSFWGFEVKIGKRNLTIIEL